MTVTTTTAASTTRTASTRTASTRAASTRAAAASAASAAITIIRLANAPQERVDCRWCPRTREPLLSWKISCYAFDTHTTNAVAAAAAAAAKREN